MQSVYLQRIMKKNAAMGYKKQSQNKPNKAVLVSSKKKHYYFSINHNSSSAGYYFISSKARSILSMQAVIHVSKEIP